MRRTLFVVLSLLLILGGLSAGVAVAAGPSLSSVTVDLIADNGDGLGFDAGDVTVWNDIDTLYIEFTVTEVDWCLLATHIAVEETVAAIPQTKKKNPIPGQFEFSENHDCATTYTHSMDLPGFNPYIAAHASLRGLDTEASVTMNSGSGAIYGPVYDSALAPGDAAWPTATSVTPWEHLAWQANAGITALKTAEAEWVSTAEYVEDSEVDSWRWVRDSITVPGDAMVTSRSFKATADDAQEVWIDGTPIDGLPVGSNANWTVVTDYSAEFDPQSGETYEFDFVFRNDGGSSDPELNPGGLIYSAVVDYRPYLYEAGWADGTQFDGKNWATYFQYTVTHDASFTLDGQTVSDNGPPYENLCVDDSIIEVRSGALEVHANTDNSLDLDMTFANLADGNYSVYIDTNGGGPSPFVYIGSFTASGGTGLFTYTTLPYAAGNHAISVWVNGPSGVCGSILQTTEDIDFTVTS